MSIDLFDKIMGSWFGYTGDYTLIAIGIIVFFLLAFVLVGIEFKFAVMFCLPLAVVFTSAHWFSPWFSYLFWFFTVVIGGYMVYTTLIDR